MSVVNSPQTRRPILSSSFKDKLQHILYQFFSILFLFMAISLGLIMFSYHIGDPSFRNIPNEPANNIFGAFGSHIADPLHLGLGLSYKFLLFLMLLWSWRLTFDKNKRKMIIRLIFFPLPLATTAIFLATYPPSPEWNLSFSYGLGGIFGDTILKYILQAAFLDSNTVLRLTSAACALLTLSLSVAVTATSLKELTKLTKFFFSSLLYGMKMVHYIFYNNFKKKDLISLFKKKQTYYDEIDSSSLEEKNVNYRLEPTIFSQQDNSTEHKAIIPTLGGLNDSGFLKKDETSWQSEDTSTVQEKTPNKHSHGSKVKYPNKRMGLKSEAAKKEEQPSLSFLGEAIESYEAPKLSLLQSQTTSSKNLMSDDALNENARMLENVLDDYGVRGEILSVKPGPVVTLYELEPAAGLKASRVISLADDIARSMSALATRVSTIPGRSVIGIELPNNTREKVFLREILSSRAYGDSSYQLPLALGKNIGGEPIVANLARMPHLLIAGTTGSGKSVGINTMILSLLYKLSPEECKLIMIDPKMLELSVYDGIPHLLSPVVTDPKKAVVALKWAVGEMEERYRKMSKMGVRNIESYNLRVEQALRNNEEFTRTVQIGFDEETGEPKFENQNTKPEHLPFIVIIVDEMADLMMVSGKDIEACIQRLAQMARAAGIHLIMATQRPSVDVITGTIKANFPTRISFQVTSKIDSRTILGEMGAEQLLGMGDMLYMANGGKITRVHGPYVSDEEVEEVVHHLKNQGSPNYISGIIDGPDEETQSKIDLAMGLISPENDGDNALYDQAVAIVARDKKCSTSYIQRRLSIGYNKAAKLVETMEEQGIVSPANHVGKREILISEI
tara:strand:+ start:785 stop:3322 length:2538 start_codon:yes stop_codon:yes gene_type:complete